MCKFFSCCSDGAGGIYYLDAKQRQEELKKGNNPDSHTFIAEYFGFIREDEDMLNKYEYNPLTKNFAIDMINNKDDSKIMKTICENIDYSTIVPEIIIKPIINPFRNIKFYKVTDKDMENLKKWASVRASVRDSVWASVRDSIWDYVGYSVRDSVWDYVYVTLFSLHVMLGNPVETSVRASVRAYVGAYVSSFFKLLKWKNIEHKEGINPFQCAIDLWECGLVPVCCGDTWKLFGNNNGKIECVYEGGKENG